MALGGASRAAPRAAPPTAAAGLLVKGGGLKKGREGGGPAPRPEVCGVRVTRRTHTSAHKKSLGSGTVGAFRLRGDPQTSRCTGRAHSVSLTPCLSRYGSSAPRVLMTEIPHRSAKSQRQDLGRQAGPRKSNNNATPNNSLQPPPPPRDTDACARPALFSTKQKCKAKVKEESSSVTCHGRLPLQ